MFGDKWDRRFLNLALEISTWSKDISTRCGCVIVRPDKTICAVGYNGFPRYVEDKKEYITNREEKLYRTIHAETNAILSATDPYLHNYSLYVVPMMPCSNCTALIIQSGIKYVSFLYSEKSNSKEWLESFSRSANMLKEANIEYKKFNE